MSDEFEDISVVDTTEPVEVASAEPAMTPVATSSEPVSEALPAEVEATQINLDPADEVLKNNSQQAYTETYAPDRVNEAATPITASAIAAKEEEREAKRSEAFDQYQDQLKQVEARNQFLNKEHDFGGMKMSGGDLEKLMNFISNPAMQDKLRERLVKSGMPKEKIDKGMKELNEYIELKKKEAEGKLTEEDERRLIELKQSETFKIVTHETVRVAEEYGIKVSAQNLAIQEKMVIASSDVVQRTDIRQEGMDALAKKAIKLNPTSGIEAEDDGVMIADNSVSKVESTRIAADAEDDGIVVANGSDLKKVETNSYISATAREFFPSAPPIMKDFEASSVNPVTASLSPKALSAGNDALPPSVAVAENKMPLALNARA